MPNLSASTLTEFSTELLLKAGASPDEASLVARSLVDANLRGYDSHGVMRIPYYIQALRDGEVVSGAELSITIESPVHVVADANWGFGQVQANRLLDLLAQRVGTSAISVGTLIHCGHIGRLGEYCEIAASRGLLSILMVNSHGAAVRVAPPGGKAPRLSTNPLAIGVPNGDEPLVLDFSTSATAEGKVRVKKIAGEHCPDGWLLDSEGRPTCDPNALYGTPPGSILPMGGAQAYKGFGLGLMIEIFCGALSGGVCAREVPFPKKGNCVFMMLLNPEFFGGAKHFQCEVEQLTAYIRNCPRIEGVERILLPGDPERLLCERKTAEGVFLDPENWKALVNLGRQLEIAVPGEDLAKR